MIPNKLFQPKPTPVEAPTPEKETVEVTDIELVFMGGHILPFTLFPDDVLYDQEGSAHMVLTLASGAKTIINKDKLLYSSSNKRMMSRLKKDAATQAAK